MTTTDRRSKPGVIDLDQAAFRRGLGGLVMAIVLGVAVGLALWLKLSTPDSDYQRLNARITAVERHLELGPK